MRELRVGYLQEHSVIGRSFVGAAPYCRYVPVGDWYRTLARAGQLINHCVRRELLGVRSLNHQFRERRGHAGVDVLHLFNQISYGRLPWISSFDGPLPLASRALAALAADRCRRLLALSRNAADTQSELLASALPTLTAPPASAGPWRNTIARKITVLRPPQPRLIAHIGAKPPLGNRPLRLLFIADDFVNGGGSELLGVVTAVASKQRRAFELIIVSPLSLVRRDPLSSHGVGTADDPDTTAKLRAARALIAGNRSWIRQHEVVERAMLLQLMRDADLGVVLTCEDRYAFAALELQAAGCPVISTDVHALPEINDERRGWLINLPKGPLGEARRASALERQQLARAIHEGLAASLQQILANPCLVRVRGERALQLIDTDHDPERIGAQLFELYLECIVAARARGDAASIERRVDL